MSDTADLARKARKLSDALAAFADALEDARGGDDVAAYDAAAAREEEGFPWSVVRRLDAGENPIKVMREHRGLTQAELAGRAGINRLYLSQLETGRRTGTVGKLRKIAAALDVDLDTLVPWDTDGDDAPAGAAGAPGPG